MNQNTTNSYISKSLDIAKDIDKKLRAEDFDIINNIGSFISSVEEIISCLFNSILIGEFITDTNFENLYTTSCRIWNFLIIC